VQSGGSDWRPAWETTDRRTGKKRNPSSELQSRRGARCLKPSWRCCALGWAPFLRYVQASGRWISGVILFWQLSPGAVAGTRSVEPWPPSHPWREAAPGERAPSPFPAHGARRHFVSPSWAPQGAPSRPSCSVPPLQPLGGQRSCGKGSCLPSPRLTPSLPVWDGRRVLLGQGKEWGWWWAHTRKISLQCFEGASCLVPGTSLGWGWWCQRLHPFINCGFHLVLSPRSRSGPGWRWEEAPWAEPGPGSEGRAPGIALPGPAASATRIAPLLLRHAGPSAAAFNPIQLCCEVCSLPIFNCFWGKNINMPWRGSWGDFATQGNVNFSTCWDGNRFEGPVVQ